MYGYIYKTTNKITGRIYIGQKKSNIFLGDKYLGSGKVLRQAIKLYGKENFTIELIESVESMEDMDSREIYWISYYNSTDRDVGYNISEGGNVNRTFVGSNNPMFGKHHTDETRKHLSEVWDATRSLRCRKHTDQEKEHMREIMLGREVTWGHKLSENAKHNDNYGMRGKHPSKSTRKLLSDNKRSYFSVNENREKHSAITTERWSDPEYRRSHCEGMRGKKHRVVKKECPICGMLIYAPNLQRHIVTHNK